jgi:histidinol-phosphate aminotransferase
VKSIADQCATRNVFLVIDEAYYLFGGPTVIDLIEDCSNLIVLRTFSKAYGLAGLRIGFMISKQENIAYLSKSRSLVECNSMSMAIATYMLENPQLMQEHVREVADGARTIKDILKNNQIPFFGGDVTNAILILLPDSSAPAELANFLREQNVYVRANFDEPIKNAVRVSIAPPEIMTAVGNQIVQFFQR